MRIAGRRGGRESEGAMLVTLLDDSVPFDGRTPDERPLGGGEKAVVGLAESLAARGHMVRVFNRCPAPKVVDGVSWQPIDDCNAAHSDVVVAHRDPALLRKVADSRGRAVLLSAPGDVAAASDAAARGSLNEYRPTLLLQGIAHTRTVPSGWQNLPAATLVMGVGKRFRDAAEMEPAAPPRAVFTGHPLRGLDWLLDLWRDTLHPRLPWAELHVYSGLLAAGAEGAGLPEAVAPLLDRAREAEARGVRIRRPRADPEMVDVYRRARAHLYPSSSRDVLCHTLAESQAVGLPAVVRPLGAADERLRTGLTGYAAANAEAFADYAARLLDDDDMFARFSAEARARQRGVSWDRAARDLELRFE